MGISAPIIPAAPRVTLETSVETILSSPELFGKLMIYTKAEFSVENPMFLMTVRHYRALAKHELINLPISAVQAGAWIPPEYRGAANIMGNYVFQQYVAENAPHMVNLTSADFIQLRQIGATRSTPFIPPNFDTAYNTISDLIARDTIMRMLNAGAFN